MSQFGTFPSRTGERVGDVVAASLIDYSPAWYAVFTSSRHEKRVAHHLFSRQIDGYLPLYRKTSRWRNRRSMVVEVPLFPGYLFTHIDRRERARVLDVPGVIDVIGCAKEWLPVPDACIESLRHGLSLGKIHPCADMVLGDRVRIVSGPLLGTEGMLVRIKNDLRVVLRIDSIQKNVAIEVDMSEVERVR